MSVLVKFFENRKPDSDIDVLGRIMEGEHEGKICFLSRKFKDPFKYVDQEIYCNVVKGGEKSCIVEPINTTNKVSRKKFDIDKLFNI